MIFALISICCCLLILFIIDYLFSFSLHYYRFWDFRMLLIFSFHWFLLHIAAAFFHFHYRAFLSLLPHYFIFMLHIYLMLYFHDIFSALYFSLRIYYIISFHNATFFMSIFSHTTHLIYRYFHLIIFFFITYCYLSLHIFRH